VQAGRDAGRAAREYAREDADRRTGGDGGTPPDDRAYRFVGGPQTVGVIDADHADARDASGVRDDAVTGREHDGAGRSGQVHTALAGQPRPAGRIERDDHRRRTR
jgi:hypothetical protein